MEDKWFVWWDCCGVNLVWVRGEILCCIEKFRVFCSEFEGFCCGLKSGIFIGVLIFGIIIGDLCLLKEWCGVVGVEIGDFFFGVVVGVLVNDFWYGVGGYSFG